MSHNTFITYPFVAPSLMVGLVSYWEGGSLTDRTSLNTLTNGATNVTFTASGGKPTGYATFIDTAYMTRANGSLAGLTFGTDSFSVNLWIKPSGIPIVASRVMGQGGTGGTDIGFRMRYVNVAGAGYVVCNICDGTTDYSGNNTASASSGAWHMATMVVDRGSNLLRTYVDGVQGDTKSISGCGSVTPNSSALFFGAATTLLGFVGDMSAMGIWHKALSPSDITNLYASGNGLTYPFQR